MKSLLIAEVVFVFSCFVFAVALYILIQESIKHFFDTKKRQRDNKTRKMDNPNSPQKNYVPINEFAGFKGKWN
jgi:hypothetical protein